MIFEFSVPQNLGVSFKNFKYVASLKNSRVKLPEIAWVEKG